MTHHDPDTIIARVLGSWLRGERPQATRPPRLDLVLERGLDGLGPALQEAGFFARIRGVPADPIVRRALLHDRIVVTKRTARCLEAAPLMHYGIIGLDALPTIDMSPLWGTNRTAQMIVDVFRDFDLGREQASVVVMVHPEGRHMLMRLE